MKITTGYQCSENESLWSVGTWYTFNRTQLDGVADGKVLLCVMPTDFTGSGESSVYRYMLSSASTLFSRDSQIMPWSMVSLKTRTAPAPVILLVDGSYV